MLLVCQKNERLVSTLCFALNHGEPALTAGYTVTAGAVLPRARLNTCAPTQAPGGVGRLPAFGFLTSSEVHPLRINWLIQTVWLIKRIYHLGNTKTWEGQKKDMNQRETKKSQEKWKRHF